MQSLPHPLVRLIPAIVSLILPLSAETHLVDNNPAHPADFRSIQEAHDAAAPGDTLLIQPSGARYGNTVLTKPLVLRGGYQTDKDYRTLISGLTLADGARGSVLESLQGDLVIEDDHCLIKRCTPYSLSVRSSSNSFIGCSFGTTFKLWPGTLDNQFKNCLVLLSQDLNATLLEGNKHFRHCLLLQSGATSNAQPGALNRGSGTITNCILSCHTPSSFPFAYVADHNLFLDATRPLGTFSLSASTAETFLHEDGVRDPDYRLQPTSLAFIGAQDRGQLGLYGGSTPYQPEFLPAVPRVSNLRVTSSNPATGVTLEFEVIDQD